MEEIKIRTPIFIFVCLLLVIPCTAGQTSIIASITVITDAGTNNPLFTVDATRLEVVPGHAGEAVFVCDDVQWLNLAGEPGIPWKVMTVLLPPDVDPGSVSASMANIQYESVAGTWEVLPTSPMMTWKNGQKIVIWPEGKRIVDGYDVDIYERDALYPEATVRLLCTGQLRKYQLAQIAVPLVRYNPVSEELLKLRETDVAVTFDRTVMTTTMATSFERADKIGRPRVQKLAVNFDEVISDYDAIVDGDMQVMDMQSGGGDPNAGYTIITTSAIEANSTKLADFVTHKQSLGFDVQVITETDFGGGTGDTASENIRAWLQANYINDNIEYVLLVGNPDTNSVEIPMKMLWFKNTHVMYSDDVPSDYYYADLTGNWDLDGDGYYGEWEDDFGTGGVDRFWEVLIGRMPYYGSIVDLDAILQKTIDYETQYGSGEDWRRNVLLPMGDDPNMRYYLGEAIKYNILEPKRWSSHRVYKEDYGVVPPPETIPTTYDNVTSVWNGDANNSDGKFGLVVWWGHGNVTASRDIMNNTHVPDLNNNYPSFTFQASCGNACPKYSNNLSYELLRNGGICTIGATHSTYPSSANRFAGTTSNAGMGYEYTVRIVSDRLSSGRALNDLRQVLVPSNSYNWANFINFNIYGDASLRIIRSEPPYYPPVRYYVDAVNGSNDTNGLSWDNAFEDVQKALSCAKENDQIWVAQGVYTPTDPNGSREVSFKLIPYTEMYGGFPVGGGQWLDRNPNLYETVLSGDLNGDDAGDFNDPSKNENSYNVVRGTGNFIIDGFTIMGGNAEGDFEDWEERGGGMVVESGSAVISNCTFTSNSAESKGGGVYTGYSGPTFFKCMFRDNFAIEGGGISCNQGSPKLTECMFTLNSADFSGGGAYSYKSNITMTGCTFAENSALYFGGGMHSNGGTVTLANCLFVLNSKTSNSGNGGGYYASGSSPILTNCTFVNNLGPTDAGGLGSHDCNAVVTNCIFWGNTTYQILSTLGTPYVTYSCIQGDWPGTGNTDTDPCFVDPCSGDYHLQSQAGRWDPNSESWIIDANTSSCIDAGDPNSDWTGELWQHGKRINMGAYGGTPEASMSLSDVGNIADLNNDLAVDYRDLLLFTDTWLWQEVLLAADLDRDGDVEHVDFAIFANNWLWGP